MQFHDTGSTGFGLDGLDQLPADALADVIGL